MPAGPFPPFESAKVLLVEGKTPLHFFKALCRHLGVLDSFDIRDFGGVTQLRPFLSAVRGATGFRGNVRSVGIVRDAENDARGAADSVRAAIQRAGVGPDVRVNFFVLPDNNSPGNIESLCLRSVADHPVTNCVGQFITCAATAGVVWPEDHSRHKAEAQIYMATLSPVEPHVGPSSYRGAWPWGSPVFSELIKFLNEL